MDRGISLSSYTVVGVVGIMEFVAPESRHEPLPCPSGFGHLGVQKDLHVACEVLHFFGEGLFQALNSASERRELLSFLVCLYSKPVCCAQSYRRLRPFPSLMTSKPGRSAFNNMLHMSVFKARHAIGEKDGEISRRFLVLKVQKTPAMSSKWWQKECN